MQHKPEDFDKEPHKTASALINDLVQFLVQVTPLPDGTDSTAFDSLVDNMEALDYFLTAAKYRTAEREERKERQTKAK